MKKVVITGADGFIGTNLIKRFFEEKIEVWAILYPEKNAKYRIEKYENVHCIECNIEDLDKRKADFPEDADAFYHFAWQGVNANDRNDLELQLKNMVLIISL